MPVEWDVGSNHIATINVSGQLGKNEYDKILSELEPIIQKLGHISLLVLLKNFTGWESTEGWEDTSFSDENDAYIKKFAIVGDEKWRDLITLFTLKGLRPVPIEYFTEGDEDKAREWLELDTE